LVDFLANRHHRRDCRRDRGARRRHRHYQPFLREILHIIAVVTLLVVVVIIGMNDDGCGGDQHGVHREFLSETLQPRRRFHFYQVSEFVHE